MWSRRHGIVGAKKNASLKSSFFVVIAYRIGILGVGETGVGWDKFWLGQCPSVPNESPHGDANSVFGARVTTDFTGATRII